MIIYLVRVNLGVTDTHIPHRDSAVVINGERCDELLLCGRASHRDCLIISHIL